MKRILSILFLSLTAHLIWAQSGAGYDPVNPPDPDVYYKLTLEAAPLSGGTVSPNSSQKLSFGQSTNISASPRLGYKFKQWMMGDSLVSTNSSFSFNMPDYDVVLTAYFDWVGNEGYDPVNPGDPDAEGYSHHVYVYASPSAGGYFNSSSFTLVEGKTTSIYAYPREGYRFESWMCNGEVVSTENPLNIRMGTSDIAYTATFVYNPVSPGEPSPNVFNAATGEVIIDNFTPGSLNSAIYAAVGSSDNYSLVQSITVIGRMQSSDFGFARSYRNCSLIDLSRTTGYTEIPSYSFDGAEALKELFLPINVENVGTSAFRGCSSLTDIYLYATTPPTLEENALEGLDKKVKLHVPSASVALYAAATGWNQLSIQSLDANEKSITVNLPGENGKYKNMTIELQNILSGQTYRCLVTDRTTYTFYGLMKNTSYNVYLKTAVGVVLGEINGVTLTDKDLNVSFTDIRTMQDVTVTVMTPDGSNVTSDVTITWLDEQGQYLRQGNKVTDLLTGTNIQYRLKLSKDLAMEYVQPSDYAYEVKAGDNEIVCTLSPIREVTISGCIKDAVTKQGISGATVSISQMLNGKYSKTFIVKTDNQGNYTATAFNAPTTIAVSAFDYVNQTVDVPVDSENETIAVEDILLNSIIGATINVSLTYTPSVAEGETAETQDWYSDYQNVTYNIYNVTTGKEVTQVSVRYPQLVILDGAKVGDRMSITAKSKKDAFKDVTIETIIDSTNRVNIIFPLVEWGRIRASYRTKENNNVVGILYDANGYLVKEFNYLNEADVTLSNVSDGDYTLISMGESSTYNDIYSKERFFEIVDEGDYAIQNFSVASGLITDVINDKIPYFDENKYKYIDRNKSNFRANTTNIEIGQYLALCGNIVLSEISARDRMTNIQYIVDLPPTATFVEKSVMIGNTICDTYHLNGSTLIVDCPQIPEDIVKFCIIPNQKGRYSPNAMVAFTIDDKDIIVPIGHADYETKNLSIYTQSVVADSCVTISGSGPANAKVFVFDNDIPIAQTDVLSNGKWSVKANLYRPYSHSFHCIHAEAMMSNNSLPTETTIVEYDKDALQLLAIHLLYRGYDIVFNQIEGTTSARSYSYVPGNSTFTFIAEFTNNDPARIKNLEFKVQASDGTVRRVPAIFSSEHNAWVGSSNYPDSKKIPVNVQADYNVLSSEIALDSLRIREEQTSIMEMLKLLYASDIKENVSILEHSDNGFLFAYKDKEMTFPLYNRAEYIPYDVLLQEVNTLYKGRCENEDIVYNIADTICGSKYILYLWNDENRFAVRITLSDSVSISSRTHLFNNQRKAIDWGAIGGTIAGTWGGQVGSGIATLFGKGDYFRDCHELNFWWQQYGRDAEMWRQIHKRTLEMLNALCEDGSPMIHPSQREFLLEQLDVDYRSAENLFERFQKQLEQYEKNLWWAWGRGVVGDVIGAFGGALFNEALGISSWLGGISNYWKQQAAGFGVAVGEGMAGNALSNLFHIDTEREKIQKWYNLNIPRLIENYLDTQNQIRLSYGKCPQKDEKDKLDGNTLSPSIDPSGYVYEGVFSNRIEGVIATAYYMETTEDIYGVLHDEPRVWDAEEYDQENPLYTDENGFYQWFVPQGMWQVKFEKEGYETTYSDWLPVPPPQLDVNIAMTQNRQPEIKEAHAYKDGVEFSFDKYMLPAYLTADNIMVSQNGENVKGEVKLMDEETAYEDESVKYASRIRFIPETPFTAGEVTLLVSNRVRSYANIPMQDAFTQSFDIEKEIKEIVVDSPVKVPYEGTKTITVLVLPADASAGKMLHAESTSEMLATLAQKDVVISETGEAQFEVIGELPGTTAITFTINGVQVTATAIVNIEIVEGIVVSEPRASLASGTSVYRGTTVTLIADKEGQKIWYTLDGTCPCDENGTRQLYTEPLSISDNVTIKMMAEDSEGNASDVVTLTYSILQSKAGIAMNEGWTWVSFNMKNDEALASTNTALASGTWTASDVIKDNQYVDMYSAAQGKWIGTMSKHGALKNTGMYKIHSSQPQTIGLTGEAVHPKETTISVGTGWNYISYVPLVSMNVDDALSGYEAQDGDVIKSQDAFATYSSTNGWEGDLTTLDAGKGYMLKRNTSGQTSFCYPIPSTSSTPSNARQESMSHRYADNMNIVGEIYGITVEDGDSLIAYVGGEVRGASRLVNGKKVFLTIHGDVEATVALVLQRDGEIIATASDMIGYKSNEVVGTGDAPTAIAFSSESHNAGSPIGNIKAIYSMNGMKMGTKRLNAVPAGAYIIYSETGGNIHITKLIKK